MKSDVAVFQSSKGNYSGVKKEMAKVNWKEMLVEMTAEQQQHCLEVLGKITKMQDRYIPKTKKYSSSKTMQTWLTRDLRTSVRASLDFVAR